MRRVRSSLLAGLLTFIAVAACIRTPSDSARVGQPTPCPFPPITATHIPFPTVIPTPLDYTTPEAYLAQALQHIRKNSYRQDRIPNYWAFHDQVMKVADDPETIEEAYAAIQYALDILCDNHSQWIEPERAIRETDGVVRGFGLNAIYPEGTVFEVLPGSPAAAANMQPGDTIVSLDGQSLRQVRGRPVVDLSQREAVTIEVRSVGEATARRVHLERSDYAGNPPIEGLRPRDNVGYIEIPHFLGFDDDADRYAADVQKRIASLDTHEVCGWIVDLRRNTGGNLWPMLAGAAPLLGEGWVGSLIERDGSVVRWILRSDGLILNGRPIVSVEKSYQLFNETPPVAVLTSRLTGSAGEGLLIAFFSRGGILVVGEPTAGLSNSTRGLRMEHGGLVFVASAIFADRNGRVYPGPILPDIQMNTRWATLAGAEDPAIDEALRWILDQPLCRGQ